MTSRVDEGVLLDEDSSAIDGCKFYSKLQIKFNYINNVIQRKPPVI